jgi:hypothetical protein
MKKHIGLTLFLLMLVSFNTTQAQVTENVSEENKTSEEIKIEKDDSTTKEETDPLLDVEKTENTEGNATSTPPTREEIKMMRIEEIKEKNSLIQAEAQAKREEIKVEMKEKADALKTKREEVKKEIQEKITDERLNARLMILKSFEVRITAFTQITKRIQGRIEKVSLEKDTTEATNLLNTTIEKLDLLKKEITNIKENSSGLEIENIKEQMTQLKEKLFSIHKGLTEVMQTLK